jgi:hypothetical protein
MAIDPIQRHRYVCWFCTLVLILSGFDAGRMPADAQNSTGPTYLTAHISMQLRRWPEVVRVLEPALKTQVASARMYNLLSEAYWATGRKGAADALMKKAHELFPFDGDLAPLGIRGK